MSGPLKQIADLAVGFWLSRKSTSLGVQTTVQAIDELRFCGIKGVN